jgi:hypothetical protein
MHLIPALRVEHHVGAEGLIEIAVVGRLLNIAGLVDEFKSVE